MIDSAAPYKLRDKLYFYRFKLLFITLVLNFFSPQYNEFSLIIVIFKSLIVTIMMLSGANFIPKGKKLLRDSWFIFGFINISFALLQSLGFEKAGMDYIRYLLLLIFFLVITVNLLQQIFFINEVTWDVIIGSFCGYLLIGMISFYLFALIDISIPDSFSGLSYNYNIRISQLFYFTFACITTLGIGDIHPLNLINQKLSVFIAAVGQFYIAIVVAILVSRYMRSKRKNEIQ